jgi:hypothetical protein
MRVYYITGNEAANEIQQEGFEDEGIHLGLYNSETREPVYRQGVVPLGMNPWDIDLDEEDSSVFLLNIPDIERLCNCAVEEFLPNGNVWIDKWIVPAEVINRHFQNRAIFTLQELINLKIMQEYRE